MTAPIVDAHVHVFAEGWLPDRWVRIQAENWARREPGRKPEDIEGRIMLRQHDPDATLLIQDMSETGVDAGVVMMLDFGLMVHDEQRVPLEAVMERYGELQRRWQGRLFFFAGVDPRRPNAAALVEQGVRQFGLRGLKLYPPNGFYPHDKECWPVYEKCLELGIPVLYHTGRGSYPMVGVCANPAWIAHVQQAFPDLTIIFGHAGYGPLWEEAVNTAAGHPNSYLEISSYQHDLPGNVDALRSKLEVMKSRMGSDRILWASDHKGGTGFSGARSDVPKWLAFMKSLPGISTFTQQDLDLVLGGNAVRVLKLDVKQDWRAAAQATA